MRTAIRRLYPILGLTLGLAVILPGCSSPTATPPTEEDEDPQQGEDDAMASLLLKR